MTKTANHCPIVYVQRLFSRIVEKAKQSRNRQERVFKQTRTGNKGSLESPSFDDAELSQLASSQISTHLSAAAASTSAPGWANSRSPDNPPVVNSIKVGSTYVVSFEKFRGARVVAVARVLQAVVQTGKTRATLYHFQSCPLIQEKSFVSVCIYPS